LNYLEGTVIQNGEKLTFGDTVHGDQDIIVEGGNASLSGGGVSVNLSPGTYSLDSLYKKFKEYQAAGKQGTTWMVGLSGDVSAIIAGAALQLGGGISHNKRGETVPFAYGSGSAGIDSVLDISLSLCITRLKTGDYQDIKGLGSIAGVKMGYLIVGGFGQVYDAKGKSIGWSFTVGLGAAFESYYEKTLSNALRLTK
jgi:hypothetical protein